MNYEELLNEWQERLGLQDYTIILRYNCKFSDLETENACGETLWSNSIRNATIRIISEEEYGNDRSLDYDFEQILVHELLHIKFGIIDLIDNTYESKVVDEVRHQLLDDLARALVMAKRGETKRKLATNCPKVKDMHEPEESKKEQITKIILDEHEDKE